ncbi:aldehyde dehydrogenase family protein, partial [Nocardia salmonicida]|uniref:aldehyde dehydrogenase family protein n=1 Tax=Nocardia salmonicida TaxID=53431 RepID=UPI00365E9E74
MSIALLRNYIDGQFVSSVSIETLNLINPVDERVVARAPISTREDVEAAVAAASRAFLTWGRTTPAFRQTALLKLADAIEAHSADIVEAQCRNTGQLRAVIATEEVAV